MISVQDAEKNLKAAVASGDGRAILGAERRLALARSRAVDAAQRATDRERIALELAAEERARRETRNRELADRRQVETYRLLAPTVVLTIGDLKVRFDLDHGRQDHVQRQSAEHALTSVLRLVHELRHSAAGHARGTGVSPESAAHEAMRRLKVQVPDLLRGLVKSGAVTIETAS